MKSRVLAVLTLACASTLCAQEFRATITGTISDPTGATIAGAKIHIVEAQSGTKADAVSNGEGQYTVPLLLAGD